MTFEFKYIPYRSLAIIYIVTNCEIVGRAWSSRPTPQLFTPSRTSIFFWRGWRTLRRVPRHPSRPRRTRVLVPPKTAAPRPAEMLVLCLRRRRSSRSTLTGSRRSSRSGSSRPLEPPPSRVSLGARRLIKGKAATAALWSCWTCKGSGPPSLRGGGSGLRRGRRQEGGSSSRKRGDR